MALLMEPGSEPLTETEKADLDAIAALKESSSIELKEKGNQFVKMGKKHYSEAIDCYTRAINQKALGDSETSILLSNRAHVNILLGNYRRALSDAEDAIKLSPTNVKALYRAAKASLSLNLLSEAKSHCENGLKHDPDNQELKKLLRQIDSLKFEQEQRQAQVSKAVGEAKDLLSAIESRGYKIGKAMFRELIGPRKPVLDKNKIVHWPVLLLYAEVMSSDFIEDFCETDMFAVHLDMMFSESAPPLPWDAENNYTREAVELYYEAAPGACLPKKKILQYLLEGTPASHVEEDIGDDDKDAARDSNHGTSSGSSKWIKVDEKRTLHNVLKEPNFIIQGIPVFYVVSKKSTNFYRKFKAGLWTLPS
ncbi:uncharacterized protein LOC133783938 [Humulus lupulus]|uniref:uncharacterized protein LOC133783938 n=1 Tax=Humulus lupulus TaxID=3486 RepID=UPI002B40B606|nr:uncharacterized protein LOC133783938 [Humulus lupulus]XP_062079506.1 uncharacterized protein LOC133783938 [Humulus lupulus]XP_062079510.1 uncharacterized protein LOC133783938 [Humulus lupulus]XP_062079520.1 uncharacterized protein LOC133783938 [Humulus lupulus]XP_062079527.1 uncharacterized protein LOC133783938 [Humulus lupulus]XP_062079536.1 uncharacterized protein LOC133783938 [Humulus lupulus]